MGRRESWIIRSPGFPVEEALSQCLAEALQARFSLVNRLRSSRRLHISTDFSQSQSGQSLTAGILVADFDDLMAWNQAHLVPWRSNDKRPTDSMAYKKVTDTDPRDIARMVEFLRCAAQLPGLLITVTVPSSPKYVFTEKNDCQSDDLKSLRGKLGDLQFEALRRFAACLAVVLKPIHRANQELVWLCDHDNIIANDDIAFTTQTHLAAHLGATIGLNTLPALVTPSNLDRGMSRTAGEGVLAIPDLAAGALGEYLEANHRHYGHHGVDQVLEAPPDVKTKANQAAVWFGFANETLARVVLSMDPSEELAMVHTFEHRLVTVAE